LTYPLHVSLKTNRVFEALKTRHRSFLFRPFRHAHQARQLSALKALNSIAQGESGEAAGTLGYEWVTHEAL
jgi:hypothetical protein